MDAKAHVRRATADDIERVVALDRGTESLPHWPVAEYVAALESDDGESATPVTRRCLFVAERLQADLAGFAVGHVTVIGSADVREVVAELESVAVAIFSRRLGVGHALCLAVIDWSRRHGATAIDLEVRGCSEGAIALYRALGFAVVGRRAGYYRNPDDDAVLMRALLMPLEPGTGGVE